ncbi:MAG: trigger factor [Candidatus Tectomicrobia bacterium]|uniref:Trigger factor n=1 Tax=Tectimicrobiota bacterium TaxID=2528274 RepID=A0A932HW48_UNCTE|nr:trigger factor [Candidatus Tectomicrobia bacterium]
MPSTVNDIDACTKRLEVSVPREEVSREMDRAFARLSGRVRIKGFRKGKVPRRILERYYGEEIQAEVLNQVIGSSYRQLLAERGMRAVGEPNVTDISMEKDAPELQYKATVEVIPPFELGEYTGLPVTVTRRPVTEEAVDEQIKLLRQRAAHFHEADRPAQAGDYVQFDIEGFEAGEPVPGTKGENQALLLGEGENEKALEDAIAGMRAGEEKEVDIEIPPTAAPALAGKTVRFRVQLKGVREPHLPDLNEDFVRSMGRGFNTVEELRAQIRREIEGMEDAQVRGQGMAELLRALVETHAFDVPPTLVKAEIEERVREVERRLGQEQGGQAVRLSPSQQDEVRERLRPEAEARVRELILVERIREKEGIRAEAGDVELQVRRLAARYGMDPEKLKRRMAVTGGLDSLISNINYNKTVEWLYERAKVEVKVEEAPAQPGASAAQ